MSYKDIRKEIKEAKRNYNCFHCFYCIDFEELKYVVYFYCKLRRQWRRDDLPCIFFIQKSCHNCMYLLDISSNFQEIPNSGYGYVLWRVKCEKEGEFKEKFPFLLRRMNEELKYLNPSCSLWRVKDE